MANQSSDELANFWSAELPDLHRRLHSQNSGLTESDAAQRLAESPHRRVGAKHESPIWLLLSQLKSPITIILIFAAVLSAFLRDAPDAIIILTIVLTSSLLGFWQEYSAAGAVEKLLALVSVKSILLRDGKETAVSAADVVSGDVVILSAGSSIPGDCRLIESRDLYVNEATLTGETFPVDKEVGALTAETALARRTNVLFMGTHVVSGSAKALVVRVGNDTEFGKISERLQLRPPETDFEHGVRRFGYFLMEVTLVLVVVIFAINVFFHKPVIEAFLFSLALAVGLTPQLLPAIISVNLSYGARRMAEQNVIVRRLSSIENFGSMNVLCSDKTGTLTQGTVQVHSTIDVLGQTSDKVARFAFLNATFESGFANPIDEAIRTHALFDISTSQKLDEFPYDFVRKRLSILALEDGIHVLITKGAFNNVLAVCSHVEVDGQIHAIAEYEPAIQQLYLSLGDAGYRTLGIAWRDLTNKTTISRDDESEMIFIGLVVLLDPPKENIQHTIQELAKLGVSLKMITGDNKRVAASIAGKVGLSTDYILTGNDLRQLSDEALIVQVNRTNVFAEIEPNQKERIICACQKAGNVVGYLGDGINDATALRAADVGISVDQAADVAKEAADIVLLKQDLGVLVQGVRDGRRTFANTMKYVFMATSANFGNMFSMAGASLFLNFLPLLPKQILLMNLLTDLPEMTIAGDAVDDELVAQPQKWDLGFIRRFMMVFGIISSLFDLMTFGVLLLLMKATEQEFQTGWFLESVVSATLVVLVVRTRRPITRSLPGKGLLIATILAIIVTASLPWTPVAGVFGFVPLPVKYLIALAAIVVAYVITAEFAKQMFYRRMIRQNSTDGMGS